MAGQHRPSLLWKLFLASRASVFLVPWLINLSIADVLLSALLPISILFPSLTYNISSRIAASVWLGIQFIFTRINRANIIVSGADRIPNNESAIVVSNHVEWTDFYMIQDLAIRAGMLGRCRWFAKRQLRWVPLLGWGLWAMGMPLVNRRAIEDKNEMDRVFRGVLKWKWPIWLVSYSEGTRYTDAKRLESEAWCQNHDRRIARHTLYPRTKGFVACVQTLRSTPQVNAVYDVTIAYAKGNKFRAAPTFAESIMTPRLDRKWRLFVHVDRHPIEELPKSDNELTQWLEDRWMEKGERLEYLRQRLEKGLPWESF